MESFLENLPSWVPTFEFSSIPITKIIIVILVLVITQFLRRAFTSVVITTVERMTRKTETTLDDELIKILKPSLSLLILLGGLWIISLILAGDLSDQLNASIAKTLNLLTVFVVSYIVYRSSSLFGQLIAEVFLKTDTDLDQVLKPFLPKIFQTIAVIVIAIKVSEIFLGQSAAALAGLLGGAGLTLGLLFKDIFYDWFCTVIIYSDGLYKEGDWVGVSGVNGFVEILEIGFRTTTLHITPWGSIVKMPNSKMISGIVENWSQNPGEGLKWGVNLTLKIDQISAKQTSRIVDNLQEIANNIEHTTKRGVVQFTSIEGNSRVIKLRVYCNDANFYFDVEKNLNLAILELMEREGIDSLVSIKVSPLELKTQKKTLERQV